MTAQRMAKKYNRIDICGPDGVRHRVDLGYLHPDEHVVGACITECGEPFDGYDPRWSVTQQPLNCIQCIAKTTDV